MRGTPKGQRELGQQPSAVRQCVKKVLRQIDSGQIQPHQNPFTPGGGYVRACGRIITVAQSADSGEWVLTGVFEDFAGPIQFT